MTTMEMISKAQLQCIKTLMGKLQIEDKDAVVRGFSGMRTDHVKELHVAEGIALIKHLKGLDPDEAVAEKMRRKIIGMAYNRAGLGKYASREQKHQVVNWLDGWCKQYGYKHKGLNSYTTKELPRLVSQFEIVLNDLLIQL